MTGRFALLIVALSALSAACLSTDGDGATATPTPVLAESYRVYASQHCAAQAANLDAGLASLARLEAALESESFETRANAARTLVDELSEQHAVFLAHLDSVSPPEADGPFIERRRVGEREFTLVFADVAALVAEATNRAELDAALETLISAFTDVGFNARDALAVASPELESALRAEPACAPLF